MARMFPERLPLQVDSPAERKLYGLFKARLPGDYTVLHGVPWLSVSPHHGAQDGEADFVIGHPALGVLVLEVKGGAIRRDSATGEWYSRDQHGVEHEIKDPFEQARRSTGNLGRPTSSAGRTRGSATSNEVAPSSDSEIAPRLKEPLFSGQ